MTIAQLELKPAVSQVHLSKARVRVLFSGRRFGKTRLMLTEAITTAVSQPGSQVFYLAPSRKMAKDAVGLIADQTVAAVLTHLKPASDGLLHAEMPERTRSQSCSQNRPNTQQKAPPACWGTMGLVGQIPWEN